jgi:WD40 repeat protein
VAIVTLEGTKSTISSEWATVQGLAWSPDGEEIWFAAAPVGTARALYAIKLSGELRPISGFPGSARLLDVSPEGRMLVCRDGTRVGIYAKPPGETKERELSWLDWSLLADLSPDGRMILFDEENEEAGPNYVACIRKTDGSPVVQLGEGAARLLSPDGRWALCRLPVPGSPLTLYPTGAGQKREIEAGGRKIAPGREVRWLPDGRRILQFGRTEDGAPTAWLLDLEKVEWVPLLPDWTDLPSGVAVAPDGLRGVASFKDRTTSIFSFEEGSMKSGPMLEPDERVVTISSDGEWIYVCSSQRRVPCPTHRLHLLTGRREAWREIGPEDLVGVMSINLRITPDGEAYAYTYSRVLSELYLAEGLA